MEARVVLAGLFHETNTFLRKRTPLAGFDRFAGDDLLAQQGNRNPMAGFLERAECHGWQVEPATYYRGRPSGMVEDEVVERFWGDLERSFYQVRIVQDGPAGATIDYDDFRLLPR